MTKPMEYFGPAPWGPALDNPHEDMVKTPENMVCYACKEPIVLGDSGLLMWLVGGPNGLERIANHRECHLRNIVGSVGHQRRACPCFGGEEEDPPGMSLREAAIAACQLAGVPLSPKRSDLQ